MISIGFKESQFYIVDDGSTDNTYGKIKECYPAVNVWLNPVSKGYIINRSNMMEFTKNDYILSLDDDSHIRSREDLEEAVILLEEKFSNGIFHFRVFNQMLNPPNKSQFPIKKYSLRGFIGCGHLIKREVIQKVGRYREELIFYCEELDYALRAYRLGYHTITQDNLIVHHRIDLRQREKQKSTVNAKGIYGREWRNIHLYSNNLIITGLYYPIGIDWLMTAYRILLAFYKMGIKEKQLSGYIKMLSRYLSFIPFIFKHSDKLSYKMFFKWFSYPDMTDGSNVS